MRMIVRASGGDGSPRRAIALPTRARTPPMTAVATIASRCSKNPNTTSQAAGRFSALQDLPAKRLHEPGLLLGGREAFHGFLVQDFEGLPLVGERLG